MRDLGGFSVGRVLPYAKRRMVGPFIFLDELGPARFPPGHGINVRPHPHIGLATVTYLFKGEMRHKDSLGCDQIIKPGDVNWMTAGRGIVHSERTDEALRMAGQAMHGIQSWVALPTEAVDTEPAFHHHPKATLPMIERPGLAMRLIAGTAFEKTSPVKTFSPIFYLSIEADANQDISLPEEHVERALYLIEGDLDVDGEPYSKSTLIVFTPGTTPSIKTRTPSKMMMLGGAPLGPRLIWWNFVASDKAKIEQAKADWEHSAASGFADSVFSLPPGETEHIPSPER